MKTMPLFFMATMIVSQYVQAETPSVFDLWMSGRIELQMSGKASAFTECGVSEPVQFGMTRDALNADQLIVGIASKRYWRRREQIYSLSADVKFEVVDEDGILVDFTTADGSVINFPKTKNQFYILEADEDFQDRAERPEDCIGKKPQGRLLGIVAYSLFELSMQFFEMVPSNGSVHLVRSGVMSFRTDHGLSKQPKPSLRAQSHPAKNQVNRNNHQHYHHYHYPYRWRRWYW